MPELHRIPDFCKSGEEKAAYLYAYEKHKKQKPRNDGQPYITHPVAVAEILDRRLRRQGVLDGDREMAVVVGLLHDTVEDTDATLEDIEANFGPICRIHVDSVTRRDDEDYLDFIRRCQYLSPLIGVSVKLADLEHNLSDLKPGDMRDKYLFAQRMLLDRYGMDRWMPPPPYLKVTLDPAGNILVDLVPDGKDRATYVNVEEMAEELDLLIKDLQHANVPAQETGAGA